MAWYPDAVRKPLTVPNRARNKVKMARPVRINFHTAVSNSNSLFGFFNSTGAAGVFSHFYVRKDGTVEQYQDTAFTAACDLDGNPDTISIETWDGYRTGYPGYWKNDSDVPPWNSAQVEALTKLARWIVRTHPSIPAKLATSNRRGTPSHGFSWHRLGVVGAPGFISRTNGGLTYSLARGKVCPGVRRINQIPAILKAATTAVSSATDPAPTGELTMSDITAILSRLDYVQSQLKAVAEGTYSRAALNARNADTATIVRRALEEQGKTIIEAFGKLGVSQVDMEALKRQVDESITRGLDGATLEIKARHDKEGV